ncbi:TPA: phage immunity protein, partial [Enterococcus faecium]|nr:phage immunity protein [Enterococcus faecium]HCR4228109.1 phage immunity protein [Enterococcus faecium]
MAKKVMGQDGKMYKVSKPFYKKVWFWVLAV